MKHIYLALITILSLASCSKPQQNRMYLYDLQILEHARWAGDHLTPIPDSFATLLTVQARRGTATRYAWSAQGRKRFGTHIPQSADTLSAPVSDSLYQLVQLAFANIPTDSDEYPGPLPEVSDATTPKIEISTFDGHTKATLTGGNAGHHTNVMLFLLRHSKKPDSLAIATTAAPYQEWPLW